MSWRPFALNLHKDKYVEMYFTTILGKQKVKYEPFHIQRQGHEPFIKIPQRKKIIKKKKPEELSCPETFYN